MTDGMDRRGGHKVFLHNLVVETAIGVHAHEHGRTQRVAVNIDVFLRPRAAPHGDDLGNVFDYDQLRNGVEALAARPHVNLQETLVDDIMALCLGFEEVDGARVATEKLDVYPNCAGVGYEMVRFKD